MRLITAAALALAVLPAAPLLPAAPAAGSDAALSAQAPDRRAPRARSALRERVQERARAPRVRQRTGGVEAIMRARDRLELTEDQLAQLDAIRVELLAARTEAAADAAELRSRIVAGSVERSEIGEAMRERLAERLEAAPRAELRDRIEDILTEEQMAQVEEWGGRQRMRSMRGRAPEAGARGGWRGRADGWQGRGGWQGRAGWRGIG